MAIETPKGFERTTGSLEGRRHCKACGKDYPVVDHALGEDCAYCGSNQTKPLQVGGMPPANASGAS